MRIWSAVVTRGVMGDDELGAKLAISPSNVPGCLSLSPTSGMFNVVAD